MKITNFILVTFLLFPLLSYTQTDDNPVLKSYLNNFEQKTKPHIKKDIKALYKLDSLKFNIDKIEAFKIQYNKLQKQLKESRELYKSIMNEPIPSGLDKQLISSFIIDRSGKHIKEIDKAKYNINNIQNNFIYLAEMTGKNNVIESKADLDKIMDIYSGFEYLTKYQNYLAEKTSSMYFSFELKLTDETGKYDENAVTCDEIKKALKLCDVFDEKGLPPYLKAIDSLSNRFKLLPEKYQNIEVIPKELRNDVSQKIHKLVLEYRDQEYIDYHNYWPYAVFNKFKTDFTGRLRKKAERIKKKKCL